MSKSPAWSRRENVLVVEDYFKMYSKEARGEEYSKKEHWSALVPELDGRTRPALEYKLQNVSGVLEEKGMDWIKGYKPRMHYQAMLGDVVMEYLQNNHECCLEVCRGRMELFRYVTEGRCIHRRARYEDGQCSIKAREPMLYCKAHSDKQRQLDEGRAKNENIDNYWKEAQGLLELDPNLTLNELFGYVKESFYDEDGINVGFSFIQKWYVETQGEKGHPVEVIDRKYPHLTGQTPYLEVMKKFGTEAMPRHERFARERVVDYLTQNPGATTREVAKATGVKYDRVLQFASEEGLKITKGRRGKRRFLKHRRRGTRRFNP